MIAKIYMRLTFLIAFGLLAACHPIQNYEGPEYPVYAGNYADNSPNFNGEITVITWNIKFAEKSEIAIAELREVEALQKADLILLQEMDKIAVEAIARSLKYNYIYIPASIHTHHNKDFGNAILSPWPLSNPQKLRLPHQNPKNEQARIAVQALVAIDETELPVYSVHTETFWLGPSKRQEQIETLLRDIGEDHPYVIVGGDFNTFTARSILDLEAEFELVGLERVSQGAGFTFRYNNFGFTLDHIFAKGFSVIDNGVWLDTAASDHFPVWAVLSLNDIIDLSTLPTLAAGRH